MTKWMPMNYDERYMPPVTGISRAWLEQLSDNVNAYFSHNNTWRKFSLDRSQPWLSLRDYANWLYTACDILVDYDEYVLPE